MPHELNLLSQILELQILAMEIQLGPSSSVCFRHSYIFDESRHRIFEKISLRKAAKRPSCEGMKKTKKPALRR